MPFPLSLQSIDALAFIISGGTYTPSLERCVGLYRSGPEIQRFMRSCGVDFTIEGSRLPALTACLMSINEKAENASLLKRIIETAANPADFIREPERHASVIEYLNERLVFDGFKLETSNLKVILSPVDSAAPAVESLSSLTQAISFDTVSRDIDRALSGVNIDPEAAITAACSIVEAVCRSILVELNLDLPSKRDVKSLYNALAHQLDLNPDRTNLNPLIASDIKTILGALSTLVHGLGALRTHGSNVHGREKGFSRVDERIARLSVHSASALALFLIETWKRKHST